MAFATYAPAAAPPFGLFFSHAWANKALVEALKRRVEARGVRCWIDTEQMAGGAWLYDKIADGIDESAVFMAFVSAEYIASDNCGKEFALAADWKKRLVAVNLIEGRWPPRCGLAPNLAGKLYINGKAEITDAALDAMLAELGLRAAAGGGGGGGGGGSGGGSGRASAVAVTELDASGVAPARVVALLRAHPRNVEIARAAARALAAAADTGEGDQRLVYSAGRRACVEAGAPAALVALAGSEAVRRDAEAARFVALAMRNLARADESKAALLTNGAAQAVVALAGEGGVKGSADAAQHVAWTMSNLGSSADGKAKLLACGAAPTLVALAGEGVVKGSAGAAQYVAMAMANLGISAACLEACVASLSVPDAMESPNVSCFARATPLQYMAWILNSSSRAVSELGVTGNAAFGTAAALIAASAPQALVAFCAEDSVQRSAGASATVSRALAYLALFPAGRAACVAAGAAAALAALAAAPAASEEGGKATASIALAVSCVARGADGVAALVAAGAPAALASLARASADLGANAAEHVAGAVAGLCSSTEGAAACAAAGVRAALVLLAAAPAVAAAPAAAGSVTRALALLTEGLEA